MQTEEARLRELVAKLEDQLAEAREVIAFYEAGDAEDDADRDLMEDLVQALKVGKVPAKLCAILYRTPRRIRYETLWREVWEGREVDSMKILTVTICKLRRALGGKDTVETVWGVGACMTEKGRAIVRQKLAGLRNREAA